MNIIDQRTLSFELYFVIFCPFYFSFNVQIHNFVWVYRKYAEKPNLKITSNFTNREKCHFLCELVMVMIPKIILCISINQNHDFCTSKTRL